MLSKDPRSITAPIETPKSSHGSPARNASTWPSSRSFTAGHRLAGRTGYAANIWPADQPTFVAAMTDYFDAMLGLSRLLLSGLGRSLGLDDGYFAEANPRKLVLDHGRLK